METNYTNGRKPESLFQIQIWEHKVDICTYEDRLKSYINRIREKTYGIPAFKTQDLETESGYKILVGISDNPKIKWIPRKNYLSIDVSPKNLESVDKEVAYLSLTLTERMRQLEGKLLSNGAAAVNKEGKGVLILGKRASGKTTLAMILCKDYDYGLVATDQVIYGLKNLDSIREGKLWLFEGDKYAVIRKSTAENINVPEYSNEFSKGFFWDEKINLKESEVGVRKFNGSAPISAAFFVNLDWKGSSLLNYKGTYEDLETSLFVSEVASRHISGNCSPLLDERGTFLNLCPSLDDNKTRKIRKEIISKTIKIPLIKIYGSDSEEMAKLINQKVESSG